MTQERPPNNVSVLGLGLMGRPMARMLAAAGYDVRGWNRSALEEELTRGIPLCRDLREAARADVSLLVLADSGAVDAVLPELERHLAAGCVVLDMGSSDPSRSRDHAARLAAEGIGWVDAPVSGGPPAAETGTLAIMAGGAPEDFARVRPLLETLGANVVHVGPAGAGHATKVANQIIVGLTLEAVAEALALAEACGLDLRLVQQALQGGSADSKILQIHGTRMIERAYVPGGKVTTVLKDLRLAEKLATEASLELPHVSSAITLNEALVAHGDGDLDCSALHKLRWQEAGRPA